MSSDWPILTKLRCKLQRCYTQATLRKVEGRSTFLATRNATIAVAKWGVTREFFLATCNAMFVALQVATKIASCNMALRQLYCYVNKGQAVWFGLAWLPAVCENMCFKNFAKGCIDAKL